MIFGGDVEQGIGLKASVQYRPEDEPPPTPDKQQASPDVGTLGHDAKNELECS